MTANNMGGSRSSGTYRYYFSNRASDVGSSYLNGFYVDTVKMITF